MDTQKQAAEVLADAERRLRELVGTAASAGEYDEAERVTQWARALGIMACEARNDGCGAGETGLTAVPDEGVGCRDAGRRSDSSRDGAARRGRQAHRKDKYPKFFRRGDQLVKIGWSKKEREEYQHKAPRRVIDALAAAIARRSGNGRLFTSDDVMPLKDASTGEEMPGYQAYVALAWFKHAGIVKQHGRSGYSAKNGPHLAEAVGASWEKVPEDVAPAFCR